MYVDAQKNILDVEWIEMQYSEIHLKRNQNSFV